MELKGILVIVDQQFTDVVTEAWERAHPDQGHIAVCRRVREQSLDYTLLPHINKTTLGNFNFSLKTQFQISSSIEPFLTM